MRVAICTLDTAGKCTAYVANPTTGAMVTSYRSIPATLTPGSQTAGSYAFAALGLGKLKVDDSLSELFRTDTREFHQYEEIDRRFPSSEYDVLAVVEVKSRANIETARDSCSIRTCHAWPTISRCLSLTISRWR